MSSKLDQKNLHLLLVEDHPLTLLGTKHFIENANISGFRDVLISTAVSQKETLSWLKQKKFDLLILDIYLPDGHGYELVHKCLQHDPDLGIVFFSAAPHHFAQNDLIKLGVRGYINKGMPSHHLTEAIMTVYEGGFYFNNKKLNASSKPHKPTAKPFKDELSFRESQVLMLLALDRTKHEIAYQLGISVRTVETYRTRLMQKTNSRSLVGLVRYAIDNGFVQ